MGKWTMRAARNCSRLKMNFYQDLLRSITNRVSVAKKNYNYQRDGINFQYQTGMNQISLNYSQLSSSSGVNSSAYAQMTAEKNQLEQRKNQQEQIILKPLERYGEYLTRLKDQAQDDYNMEQQCYQAYKTQANTEETQCDKLDFA